MSTQGERLFGCLFCTTGRERDVAERIRRICPDAAATAVLQEKHKSEQGVKRKVTAVALPGYVFFSVPADDPDLVAHFPRLDVIRLLRGSSDGWALQGDDCAFAKWVFSYGGLLSFSHAYVEGERIRIVSGPLKDMEGAITKVDKRGRSGQVTVKFEERAVRLWLGFDLVQPLPKDNEEAAPKPR